MKKDIISKTLFWAMSTMKKDIISKTLFWAMSTSVD